MLGKVGYHTIYEATDNNAAKSIWSLGWQLSKAGYDPLVKATTLRWGNFDTVTNGTRWAESEVPSTLSIYANPVPTTTTLPSSFYLSGQPGWWTNAISKLGVSIPWPAVGPDVTGGNISTASGHAFKIPAQVCWDKMVADPAYAGDPAAVKIFSRTACYGDNY